MQMTAKARGAQRRGGVRGQPIHEFLNFLVPPVVPGKRPGEDGASLADFEREMSYAHNWRELRGLVEEIARSLESPGMKWEPDAYATFALEKNNRMLLLGVKRNEAGDELHIIHRLVDLTSQTEGSEGRSRVYADANRKEARADGEPRAGGAGG